MPYRFSHIFLFLLLALVTTTSLARGLDPAKKITQYIHQNWQVKDGLPQNSINAILQTADGYIWLGTYEGLVRFDGVKFTVFNTESSPGLKSDRVLALCEDGEQNMWITTLDGKVFRYRNGLFTEFPITGPPELKQMLINRIFADGSGTIWLLTLGTHLYKLVNGTFIEVPTFPGVNPKKYAHMERGKDGKIYLLSNSKLMIFEKDERKVLDLAKLYPSKKILAIASSNLSGITLVTEKELISYPEGSVTPYKRPFKDEDILLIDSHNALWSRYPCLTRSYNGAVDTYPAIAMLSSEYIHTMYEDREGNLWIGTAEAGLHKFSDAKFSAWSKEEGLKGEIIWSVCTDTAGTIWASTLEGYVCGITPAGVKNIFLNNSPNRLGFSSIYPLRNGSLIASFFNLYSVNRELVTELKQIEGPYRDFQALFEDSKKRIWLGSSYSGFFLIRNGKLISYGKKDGSISPYVSTFGEDKAGDIWVGTKRGLLRLHDEKVVQVFNTANGLPDDWVRSIHFDKKSTLWIGTANGLARYRNGVFRIYKSEQGMFDNLIHTIVEDDNNNLWFSCNKGIYYVPKEQFEMFDRGEIQKLSYVHFGIEDGLKSDEGNGSVQPAGWKCPDGRLLFATAKGIAIINPNQIVVNNIPPPVIIESFAVNNVPCDLRSDRITNISAGTKTLDFSFTALSYLSPLKNIFKIKLEGFDDDWQSIGNKHDAHYTNIPPGDYIFKVIACNNDGIWNMQGAVLRFTIPAPFYITWWFRLSVFIAVLALIVSALRAYGVRKFKRKMESLEKDRALELERARIAKDMHDEIGGDLTKIAMLSEIASSKSPMEKQPEFAKIIEAINGTIGKFDEIVWVVNPSNDTLGNLMAYLSEYAEQFFEFSTINYRFDFPNDIPDHKLSSQQRHQIFLVVKEALNNTQKYSGAQLVTLGLAAAENYFEITIRDDGAGFNEEKVSSFSNGLRNMKERILSIKGEFELTSMPGKGTLIRLKIYV